MITIDQFISLLTMGIGLIVLGLWPGLLQSCADGINDVSKLLFMRMGAGRSRGKQKPMEAYWFALAGVMMILLTLLAYVSQ